MMIAGKSYLGGRFSTVDLLVLTSLDQFVSKLKILFFLFYKTSYLNEEVNCTEPSTSISVPWWLLIYLVSLTDLICGDKENNRLGKTNKENITVLRPIWKVQFWAYGFREKGNKNCGSCQWNRASLCFTK